MAVCDQGYLCDVCGKDVEDLTESDLYLRYVLGEVDPETLHLQPERHLACHPSLSQFIVAEGFPTPTVEGIFSKAELDPVFVEDEECRVTKGYLRLQELPKLGLSIIEYPLPEVRRNWIGALDEAVAPSDSLSTERSSSLGSRD